MGFQVHLLQKWIFSGNVIYFYKLCPYDNLIKKPKLSYWGFRSSEIWLRCWVNGCRPFGSIRPLHGNLDHWWWRQYIRGSADKSLVRPGRKQATATKLGIYSTYSPRSSIHFLARCSKFCPPPKKKKIRKLSVQPPLRDSNDPRVGRKNGDLPVIFSVQGTGGSPTGPGPENRVVAQDTGSPGRPISSGLQVPGEPGHCLARTRPPWRPSRDVFPSKCSSIAPAEMSNTPRW